MGKAAFLPPRLGQKYAQDATLAIFQTVSPHSSVNKTWAFIRNSLPQLSYPSSNPRVKKVASSFYVVTTLTSWVSGVEWWGLRMAFNLRRGGNHVATCDLDTQLICYRSSIACSRSRWGICAGPHTVQKWEGMPGYPWQRYDLWLPGS